MQLYLLRYGSAGAVKDIRESIEFVESFENVVLCFDNAGQSSFQEEKPQRK